MNLTPSQAHASAVQLVTKAIENGAIKLSGPSGGATPTDAAGKDAEYLIALITKIALELPKTPGA